MILNVVLCACETWSNKLKEERRTSVFGNMMLRIFGSGRDDVTGGRRELHNKKLRNLWS